MFVLLSSDTGDDIDYISVYGPYPTREEAEAAIPALPYSNVEWRVKELGTIADFQQTYDEEDDAFSDEFNALVRQYRGVENVPAPNPVVRRWALDELRSAQGMLTHGEATNDKRTVKYAKKNLLFWDKIAQKHRD